MLKLTVEVQKLGLFPAIMCLSVAYSISVFADNATVSIDLTY